MEKNWRDYKLRRSLSFFSVHLTLAETIRAKEVGKWSEKMVMCHVSKWVYHVYMTESIIENVCLHRNDTKSVIKKKIIIIKCRLFESNQLEFDCGSTAWKWQLGLRERREDWKNLWRKQIIHILKKCFQNYVKLFV